MTTDKIIGLGLTFDDVLLAPAYSQVLPDQTQVSTCLTSTIGLNIPLISAAMDTVTEHEMAIAMARCGGVGVIHKNMSVAEQAKQVSRVKKSESGMISDPITITPDDDVRQALSLMQEYSISGLPVVENDQLVGIVTNRDVRFITDMSTRIRTVMTSQKLITVPIGTSMEDAKSALHANRIEKLLVVDHNGMLAGLITIKDIENLRRYPDAAKDSKGRLRVGAAIGIGGDRDERVEALLRAEVDFLVLDSAHGHSRNIINAIRAIKTAHPGCQLIAGNIATYEGAVALAEAGADAVKVGIGPGSICTTRIVSGVGVPQITAIMEVRKACDEHNICLIADGGVKYSGDIVKAIAAGAHTVMMGSMLAGTDESPGETIIYQGRSYKIYRGMGSIDAMRQGSGDRYFQSDSKKLVPEGIVGRVPSNGTVGDNLYQMVGGIRSGMGYCGCADIETLRNHAKFMQITSAGLRESHVHDVVITQEAPNYRAR